jgi:WD40 repeat protein
LVEVAWSPYGILAGYSGGTAALVDPASGAARPLPPGVFVGGATMLAPDLLLATRSGEIFLWNLADDRLVISHTVPSTARLTLDAAGQDGSTFVWRGPFGDLYALRVDAVQEAITELWHAPDAALNRPPSALHPTAPLLATVANGNVIVVDLAQGNAIWQSAGVAAVAGQSFLTVQWSTDGQYLITQAEPPLPSTFAISIGVWRWDAAQRRPVLLQELPAAALLAVSPDAQTVLALPPGELPADTVWAYPLLADAVQLRRDVLAPCQAAQAGCLLTRSLAAAQRQALGLQGR